MPEMPLNRDVEAPESLDEVRGRESVYRFASDTVSLGSTTWRSAEMQSSGKTDFPCF